MDNLLIVRMADRSKERYSRKRRRMQAPLGMNMGLVIGIGIGAVAILRYGADPLLGLGIGIGFGLIFGGLFGRFLKPRHRYERVEKAYSFEGLPFESEKDSDENSPREAEKA